MTVVLRDPLVVRNGAPGGDEHLDPWGVQRALEDLAAAAANTQTGANPIGPAGGVLSGTFPNPGFAVDMATQAELDAAIAANKDKSFTFLDQIASPSATWTITHNLGKRPHPDCFDNTGREMRGSITHVSTNVLTVEFSASVSGVAYLN